MANKMLIDSTHAEETRVVVVRGSRVEEFDFESASRRQLRGNIYLAKVTRVEPSLQAAFVEYGGNRHGFLAFSEIHPDYYQIPVADRQALLAEEEKAHAAEEEQHEEKPTGGRRRRGRARPKAAPANGDESVSLEPAPEEVGGEEGPAPEASAEAESAVEAHVAEQEEKVSGDDDHDDDNDDEHPVESIGAGDALEEMPERRPRHIRSYKIQEVIKRRQVLLVQVVKEERGTKGAALTTYLSLAGRYSVLMPNTARGGGISRKITSAQDRKRLKEVASDLEVPEGMGVILRTAGASRTKPEIKRDFEYLMRLWETVRDLTLKSAAPTLVYEEGSLIKRSIRDLYNKDIDEVLVAGEDGYREAKDFMRMLMPSHAKIVQPYRDSQPLFSKSGVEAQLDAMFSNVVTMKSGGYIVINQTEALVAIDVNSGRSTREHNIEDTALKTNLEAAEEVARQMRLRDLAGLIVIDFIDMEESRNNKAVEKKLKDCLKDDRARIQLGRISHFGLMEMSRQRIRTGVLESSSEICPVCAGVGTVRAVPSVALHVLRMVEEHLRKDATRNLLVKTRNEVALYILNQKRGHLGEIESRFGVTVLFAAEEHLPTGQHLTIERTELATGEPRAPITQVRVDSIPPDEVVDEDPIVEDEEVEAVAAQPAAREPQAQNGGGDQDGSEGGGRRRRRRRRRRGGGSGEASSFGGEPQGETSAEAGGSDEDETENGPDDAIVSDVAGDQPLAPVLVSVEEVSQPVDAAAEPEAPVIEAAEASDEEDGKRRRRGRRGGRRSTKKDAEEIAAAPEEAPSDALIVEDVAASDVAEPAEEPAARELTAVSPAAPQPEDAVAAVAAPTPDDVEQPAAEETRAAPAPVVQELPEAVEDPDRPRRTGWWSKRVFGG
ncbi:ribonuclease E [Methylopila capsulata]|uniref:Ribonuclease E n=1 Tax=Methylopila capsulata TaxID=61654 RepID=A0A9W6IUG0_9HYPH|nr:ribonuclease E/G [Methylopila capsulata]MBM7850019.1 ribonuclease E [Methylopila capsulata]GLK55311.1 ribonuclease E [Methylopila capsulata]